MSQFHTPVMLNETLNYLDVKPGNIYVDATLGGGGHTGAILEKGGRVIAFDVDSEAVDHVRSKLGNHPRLTLINTNFTRLTQELQNLGIHQVSGILFDLGVSSWQLTQPHRGFTFAADSNLDMRMDQNLTVQAKDLLAALGEKELAQLFNRYGDEPKARHIAAAIIKQRRLQPISTTAQLSHIVESVYRHHRSHLHPATKVFQALRIAVNDELHNLEHALPQAFDLLEPGGRLVIISFHSGEDRIVKQFFNSLKIKTLATIHTSKPIVPTPEELSANPRSRSAKLRSLTKL